MPTTKHVSEDSISVAYEDRFLVVGLTESPYLAPHSDTAIALGSIISNHLQETPESVVTFDFRGLQRIYNDVHDFVDGLISEIDPQRYVALIEPSDEELAEELSLHHWITNRIASTGPSFGWKDFDLTCIRHFASDPTLPNWGGAEGRGPFRDTAYTLAVFDEASLARDRVAYSKPLLDAALGFDVGESEVKRLLALADAQAATSDPLDELALVDALEAALLAVQFDSFAHGLHQHSMLVEFTMQVEPDGIAVVPYHAHASYDVEHPRKDDILVGRPSVLASRTRAAFSRDIKAFESLLSSRGVKEQTIQRFLEEHPQFLQGLNYTSIHPQVVLERNDGTSLRPDFLLEPRAGDWCDILDLKLPTKSIFVGRRDRITLACAMQEVASQLREYASYFEDPRYRKMLFDRYGLRAYKPKLIAVVGRDSDQNWSEQHRRATTCYADLQIMTFDHLLDMSKQRILI